jgi:hypothetical protein
MIYCMTNTKIGIVYDYFKPVTLVMILPYGDNYWMVKSSLIIYKAFIFTKLNILCDYTMIEIHG